MAKVSNRPAATSRPPAHAWRPPPTGRNVVRTPVLLPGEEVPAPSRYPGQPRRLLTTLCFLVILVGMLVLGRYVGAESRPGSEPVRAARSAPVQAARAAPVHGVPSAPVHSARSEPVHPAPSAPVAAMPRPGRTASAVADGTARPEPATSAGARPEAGTSGQFAYVPGFGPVLGRRGPIHRFKVAVERPTSASTGPDFADEINRTLADGRSWIASGQFRLQRVPASAHAEFTVYLASPKTSERMCSRGGLETAGYTSCRLPGQVIINDARWEGAVRDYRATLETYRQYAINHEVGHQLGHGHESCPGRGRPAPVMMQQTLGLKGCVANAWPFRNGKRYAGPATL